MNIKWINVLIGVIIALILVIIFSNLIGQFGAFTGLILASIYVGYTVGGNYTNGAVNSAAVGVLSEIIVITLLVTVFGDIPARFVDILTFFIMGALINGIIGAFGGIIGIFIKGSIPSKERTA